MRIAKVNTSLRGTNMLPTAPIPEDLKAKPIHLTDNARTVLHKRYVRRGADGKPAETEHEMFWRVAYHVALAEAEFADDETVMAQARAYYELLTNLRFFPNSPTFTGAGTPLGQLAACFTENMRVTTVNGLKRIADLRDGDLVLTHRGRYRPVRHAYKREYAGELLTIKIHNIGTPLEVTPEHPILTMNGWVNAGDLKVGDWVAIGALEGAESFVAFDLATIECTADLEMQTSESAVRVRRPSIYQNSGLSARWMNRFIPLSTDLARLCGYYVSEGTLGSDDEYVRFTFSREETDYQQDVSALLTQIFGGAVSVNHAKQGTWSNINFYSRTAALWFKEHFGRHAHSKRIPYWLQQANQEIQDQFLIGLLRGDGVFYERQHTPPSLHGKAQSFRKFGVTLSNPSLIHQIWQMCIRLGYDASVRSADTPYVTPNARPAASLNIPPVQAHALALRTFGRTFSPIKEHYVHIRARRIDNRAYYQIESVQANSFSGTVYNCEVEEDNTYVTEGVVVHNCFVLAIDDDMGRTKSGIFQTLRDAALIQQTGGGNGFAFSRLRPKGALVNSSRGEATGPVGFLRVYDQAFGEIAQGGSRRGANMAVLRVDHPDIREFITAKTDESSITNFNISVGITDAFMRAVENDTDFDLINPQNGEVWETVRARDLFDLIVKQAHHNGEPGVLFLDTANRSNPVPHLYELESTNPCFVGSTRIATDRGLIAIKDLAESDQECMVATDNRAPFGGVGKPRAKTYGVSFRRASPAWKTRENAEVFKLTTEHGYSVTVTPDHKFLTPDRGYIELKDLKLGDRLMLQSGEGAWSNDYILPNSVTVQDHLAVMGRGGDHATGMLVTRRDFAAQYMNVPTHWSHSLGVVLGWLVGDGWLTSGSNSPVGMIFSAEKDEAQQIVHSAMQDWFGEGHLHQRGTVNQLTYGKLPYIFFQTLGVSEGHAHEKHVPTALWTAPREAVIGFLQGLFTADGTVTLSEEKKSCDIRLASASYQLLEEVQLLLINLGIVSKIHHRRASGYRSDGKGGKKAHFAHDDFELIIGRANRNLFLERVGFIDSQKQDKAMRFVTLQSRRAASETFVTKIKSIVQVENADVYDLSESQTRSLIANGTVVHNCGEQFLGPFENCCLGSINLAQLPVKNGCPDWKTLQAWTELSTRFLDDVVSANSYVPSVPQLAEAAHRVRRIGLGVMGLADLMYKLNVRYGSEEGQEFAGQITEFVRYHTMKTSIALAKERGAFPAIKGSIYDPDDLKWQPPTPLFPYSRDWGRPSLDWDKITKGIKKNGIRNGAQMTVAPTGTIATVSGCEGYGCEPVFALAYIRHVNDKGRDLQLQYTSPLFEQALQQAKLSPDQIQRIVEYVNAHGSCQGAPDLPDHIRHTFVVSGDITAEEHIRMQAAMQRFVDNAISKTCNFFSDATVEDVATAYQLGWKLGCKGLTVYVTGSRDKVVLETHATAKTKEGEAQPEAATTSALAIGGGSQLAALNGDQGHNPEPQTLFPEAKKPRPRRLEGRTYRIGTPLGGTYITINENGQGRGHPFELFIHTSKAGSETAAISEALGRLSSLIMRMASPILPRDRVKEIIRQLEGIGGDRSIGFGAQRVRSLPDGIAQVLREYLDETSDVEEDYTPLPKSATEPRPLLKAAANAATPPQAQLTLIGDLCPECGEASLVNEEGCRKCYNCGYSEC